MKKVLTKAEYRHMEKIIKENIQFLKYNSLPGELEEKYIELKLAQSILKKIKETRY